MSAISYYRRQIMGLAILWVVLYHAEINFSNSILYIIKTCGYGGVDFFFFCSGMGLYHALNKNNDIVKFYKRRISRIFPSYLPVIICWFAILLLSCKSLREIFRLIKEFLSNISMTGWALGEPHQFNWYIQALFWLYLLTPIVYELIICCSKKKHFIALLIILFCLEVTLINHDILMAASRIPIFILGMMLSYTQEQNKMPKNFEKVSIIVSMIGICLLYLSFHRLSKYMWSLGFYWHPFVLIVPGACLILCYFFNRLKKVNVCGEYMVNALGVLGDASFEIYLIHILIFKWISGNLENNFYWTLIMLGALFLGICYNKLVNFFRKAASIS